MLSLFRFLYKHSFVVYFIVLEVIAFSFIIQKNPFQRASFLNSSDSFVANTYQVFDEVVKYLNLTEVNKYLSDENSELRSESLHYYKKSFDTNIVFHDSSYAQEFAFSGAKIIRNTTHLRNNYITLNRGELNGVQPGMGVISNLGVVGIVLETSKNFSAVMSVLNKESKISARVKKNGYFGSIIWEGKDYRIGKLQDIPNHVSLVEGDSIVTSGFSGIFPAGVPIGTVETVQQIKGSGFLEVEVQFTEDYRKMSFVHVVKYLHKKERSKLESSILSDD